MGIEMRRIKKFSVYLMACTLLCLSNIANVYAYGGADSLIRKVDFRNFSYPGFWSKGHIKIKDGKLSTESKYCMSEYKIESVDYLDLTGDGKEEALVNVSAFTACGSSGVSQYFYIYTIRNGRLRLLWRFSTGSEGICGLKDFHIGKRELIFELFGDCRIGGIKFAGGGIECCPEKYTRIRVAWNGQRFREISSKVFPYVQGSGL